MTQGKSGFNVSQVSFRRDVAIGCIRAEAEAAFIEPMECLAMAKLPDGRGWVYEIKLDGASRHRREIRKQVDPVFASPQIFQQTIPVYR